MNQFLDRTNGWMMLFRIITPALLGVLFWVMTDTKTAITTQVSLISSRLEQFSNDYYRTLISIEQRLASLETQLRLLNGRANHSVPVSKVRKR